MLYSKSSVAKRILIIIICIEFFLLSFLGGYLQLKNLGLIFSWQKLVFDDEFNGVSLDTSKWNIENTAQEGYKNCCLDYGIQHFTPQALSFFSGSLRISTRKGIEESSTYISGAITTENKFSFLYGRVDIRAKLPKTKGFWPALWLLPNGSRGIAPFEIDMMELSGTNPTTIYMTNHWGKQNAKGYFDGPDFSAGYHVFSIVWGPKSITWYIDDRVRFQSSQGIPNKYMYIIINSTLGGKWVGNPNAATVLPQYMDIDYVRVYQ